ncbi:stalk domain-containing protein [Paenibacillus daejeonensis]|uniref:stalk domain-containing protein n=1 Tax=Paenibacillus daejeonensis TaxID=135193 RepID=UPI00036B768C|nr:stalk domain-containing protein [Paenibacillus daejeonensis]
MYSNLRKLGKISAAALLSGTLLLGALPAGAAAPAPAPAVISENVAATYEPYRIVAIGDSLTAGYEFGFTETSVPYGYVERVYEQALFRGRAEVANYGILGLRIEGLEAWLAAARDGRTVTPAAIAGAVTDPRAAQIVARTAQLGQDLQQADLVVITIGANNFTALIDMVNKSKEEIEAWRTETMNQYEASMESAIQTILEVRPEASIVISDFYSPVPNSAIAGVTHAQYQLFQESIRLIQGRLGEVVKRFTDNGSDVRAAYSAEAFVGKELGMTYIMRRDIHPNQVGYAAIGGAFAQSIWGEERVVAARPEGVGISVVVDGSELITVNRPVLKENRTYLAIKDIADAMKATTVWDGKAKTATIRSGGREVVLQIDSSVMRVNGQPVTIDTPAYLQPMNGEMKTYVPLAVLADGLGFQVVYSAPTKTAFINK